MFNHIENSINLLKEDLTKFGWKRFSLHSNSPVYHGEQRSYLPEIAWADRDICQCYGGANFIFFLEGKNSDKIVICNEDYSQHCMVELKGDFWAKSLLGKSKDLEKKTPEELGKSENWALVFYTTPEEERRWTPSVVIWGDREKHPNPVSFLFQVKITKTHYSNVYASTAEEALKIWDREPDRIRPDGSPEWDAYTGPFEDGDIEEQEAYQIRNTLPIK